MKSCERVDDTAPKEIIELLRFPYEYFTKVLRGGTLQGGILLDIASGEAGHREFLLKHFDVVKSYDYSYQDEHVKFADIRDIPEKDNSIDETFCFETIEHLDYSGQRKALEELKRVTAPDGHVVIGSVDALGEDWIGGHQIFKKANGLNPYHVRELDCVTFPRLIEEVFQDVYYMQSHISGGNFPLSMKYGLNTRPKAFCNYAVCRM